MLKNKFIKKIVIILIILISVLFICSLVYAENDVNVDGTDDFDSNGIGGNSYMFVDMNVRAARISLWDIEKQALVRIDMIKDLVDYSTISRSDVKEARRLSTMVKPQIIGLNYQYEK